jgi:hypothetical protein
MTLLPPGVKVHLAFGHIDMREAHVMASERLHGDDSVLQKHTERMIEMV